LAARAKRSPGLASDGNPAKPEKGQPCRLVASRNNRQLAKSPRRGAKAEAGAEADGEGDADGDDIDADGDDAAVADEAA
jgi:hypothetical protein